MGSKKEVAKELVSGAGWVLGPLGNAAAKALVAAFDNTSDELAGKSNEDSAQMARDARVAGEIMQAKAKAAFEMALASRIHTAAEVEVEEHYDAEGSGGLGLDVKNEQLGLHGRGRKVTRRVVRLKGWPDNPTGEVEIDGEP